MIPPGSGTGIGGVACAELVPTPIAVTAAAQRNVTLKYVFINSPELFDSQICAIAQDCRALKYRTR